MSADTQQRVVPFGRPWITDEDRQAVAEVLDGYILTHGPKCREFEENFSRFMGPDSHCVSVSSGMAALHLAYLHFGVGPGDEVIVPAMTHTATVHAVEWVGAKPVFIDAEPATGNVTAEAVESAVTERTKALSVVHFQGIPCDMPAIMQVAERHGLKVIEDCALAVGGRIDGKHVGLFGDAACFSFYPVKHLTCGEGGMFATRHPKVAAAVHKLRAFGVDRRHDERSVPGVYDVPTLGLNYRMSELQAALGVSQLSRIETMLEMRADRFHALKTELERLPNLRALDSQDACRINAHYGLSLILEGPLASRRDDWIRSLKENGVGTSVYYPQPVPRMTYYRDKYGYDASRYPVAEQISDEAIALPVGPHLSHDDLDYILQHITALASE